MRTNPTLTELVTHADLLAALEKAVSIRGPEWIYNSEGDSCRYRWTLGDQENGVIPFGEKVGDPACLVGVAFDILGILDLWVPEGDPHDLNECGVSGLDAPDIRTVLDPSALWLALSVQQGQDGGLSWGDTLEGSVEAEKEMEASHV